MSRKFRPQVARIETSLHHPIVPRIPPRKLRGQPQIPGLGHSVIRGLVLVLVDRFAGVVEVETAWFVAREIDGDAARPADATAARGGRGGGFPNDGIEQLGQQERTVQVRRQLQVFA